MKTFREFITETNTTRAVSIAARLKGGINRLKAKIPGTHANKVQKIKDRLGIKEDELEEKESTAPPKKINRLKYFMDRAKKKETSNG